MKISARERELVLVKKEQRLEPANKGKKSQVRVVAEKYGLNPETLRQRQLREPDVPLEELAQRPVANRQDSARKGGRGWRKNLIPGGSS